MDLKKTLSLCFALLLVVGFSSTTFALDVIATAKQGVWIRTISPDSGKFAKIADTIRVNVLTVSEDLVDSLYIAIVTDTSATLGQVQAVSGAVGNAVAKNTTGTGPVIIADGLLAANASPGGGRDTFKLKVGVAAGDTSFASDNILKVLVFFRGSSTSGSFEKISNLLTGFQILPGTSALAVTQVGDGKRFSIDGKRPVSTAVLDSVRLDTVPGGKGVAASQVTSGQGFKKDSKVAVRLHINIGQVIASGASKARVVIVGTDQNVSTPSVVDSALGYNKVFEDLFAANVLRDTFTVAENQFRNNQRIQPVVFLEDAAGNLSASSAAGGESASSPTGFTSGANFVYLGDSTIPKITPKHPHPDSALKRFSGAKAQTVSLRKTSDGSNDPAVNLDALLKPLEFKVSEQPLSVKIKIGDSTLTAAPTAAELAALTADTKILTSIGNTTPAGKAADVEITATDSIGNSATLKIAGTTFDETKPKVTQQFPTQAKAPKNPNNNNKPTINAATKDPVIRIDEALDSMAVRYIEVGASPPHTAVQGFSKTNTLLSKVGEDIVASVTDSLKNGKEYTLEILLVDKAGNAGTTGPDTLTYTADFNNPIADSFRVAVTLGSDGKPVHPDSVIAGQQFKLTLTAIDSGLTNAQGSDVAAVTYRGTARVRAVTSGGDAVEDVKFGPAGTAENPIVTDNGDGTATLNTDGWIVGTRNIFFTSTVALDNIDILVEDISTDADGNTVVNFSGTKDSVTVDAAEMARYEVKAWETGEDGELFETSTVSGDFSVSVVATDKWGNWSTKTRQSASASLSGGLSDSTGLLDTRIAKALVLKELFVEFSTNRGDAQVPSGPQAVGAEMEIFTAVAPDATGDGLWVGVRTFNESADSSGFNASLQKHRQAQGNTGALSFVPSGEVIAPPVEGAPAAPETLIVQDYRGADGKGDHGGFVLVSFPNSEDHAAVSVYRIHREIWVTTTMDDDGNLVVLGEDEEPVKKFVPWAALDAVPAPAENEEYTIQRAVIPTLDNVPTRWAVTAERGKLTSERTTSIAGKRVFTRESVQQIVQLLGVKPDQVLSNEELLKQFEAPQDYVKSILGDQKNLTFAALDPDVTALLGGSSTVPQSIRTADGGALVSARTVSANAVAAVDNIPPRAVTEAGGETNDDGGITLSWTASADDRIVAYSSYRGFSIPIAGVDRYQVLRSETEGEFDAENPLAILEPGSTSFIDSDLPEGASQVFYRVDALDLDNLTPGTPFSVTIGVPAPRRFPFFNAAGDPVYIQIVDAQGNPTGRTPLREDFEDFVRFAQAFGKLPGEAGHTYQADTNDDDVIDFGDFINFARAFDRRAVQPAGKRVVPAPTRPGVNDNVELSLNLDSDRVLVGQTISVTVSAANAKSLLGYGMVLNYDPSKFEFVSAAPAENDLMKASGGETPLFQHWLQDGQVKIANAVINGGAVEGDGALVTLTFKVLQEFEENARFEIAEGVVFDPEQLSNLAVALGTLNVESTPTEFALLQNFPNPFNPETTIRYNLAEGGDVSLRIYNIVGQVVRTLVAERQTAGRYQVRWNGTDDRGVPVSSGIYFYQIAAGGKFQDVKRLMLLK